MTINNTARVLARLTATTLWRREETEGQTRSHSGGWPSSTPSLMALPQSETMLCLPAMDGIPRETFI